jgi:hypothetical protein
MMSAAKLEKLKFEAGDVMKNEINEKLRSSNIIWSASGDYSFKPDIWALDDDGQADVYWNFIIGAVHRYYDYEMLERFFVSLGEYENYDLYVNIAWLGLENCSYLKGIEERPVLKKMRLDYAGKMSASTISYEDIYGMVKKAHFMKVLGMEHDLTGRELNLLNNLEFSSDLDTKQIVELMKKIISDYFGIYAGDVEFKKKNVRNKLLYFGNKNLAAGGNSSKRKIDIGSLEHSVFGKEKSVEKSKLQFQWLKFIEKKNSSQREYIEDCYGIPLLSIQETKALESKLCVGNHKNCHLHITRGKFGQNNTGKKNLEPIKRDAILQRDINRKYYFSHLARNNNSILKLTDKIKNTLLVNLDSYNQYSEAGTLIPGKIWRNTYLNDNKIFIKNIKEDMGNLCVDIMLDASASQLSRQEKVAAEGFIIAESFTRLNIPVKVYSYCSMRDYTVINIFRDYREKNKNDNIFKYAASGFNRDGLAIRAALNMMKETSCENKVLIILSDGKPNDLQKIYTGSLRSLNTDYSDEAGVKDTALEVRGGNMERVSVLCVFTGDDEDIPAAKEIYGRNLARIRTAERFADTVGVLMANVLNNLS